MGAGVRRAYWAWGLMAIGVIGLFLSLTGTWYEFSAEAPEVIGFGGDEDDDVSDPRIMFHTDFWHDVHTMIEGSSGGPGDYESVPAKAGVMGVVRTFHGIGMAAMVIALIGLLFRVRGLVDGKGVMTTVAVLGLASMTFGMVYFAVNIADAYNTDLDRNWDASPEISFFTFGSEDDEGTWLDARSGPRLGWYAGSIGILALIAAYGLVFATELGRARDILVNDEAANEAYGEATRRRQHVLDRIREEGRG